MMDIAVELYWDPSDFRELYLLQFPFVKLDNFHVAPWGTGKMVAILDQSENTLIESIKVKVKILRINAWYLQHYCINNPLHQFRRDEEWCELAKSSEAEKVFDQIKFKQTGSDTAMLFSEKLPLDYKFRLWLELPERLWSLSGIT